MNIEKLKSELSSNYTYSSVNVCDIINEELSVENKNITYNELIEVIEDEFSNEINENEISIFNDLTFKKSIT